MVTMFATAQNNSVRDPMRAPHNNMGVQMSNQNHKELNNHATELRHNNDIYYQSASIPPVAPHQMDRIVQVLKNISFDNQRVETAKLCVELRPMFAHDIMLMAKTFTFDDKRMEFVLFAFPYCIDKENYYDIGNTFTFVSNRDKFYKELKLHRKNRR